MHTGLFVAGGTVAIFLLGLAFLRKKEISFPKGFWIYGMFLLFFLLSLLWSLDWWKSLISPALYLSGGVFWGLLLSIGLRLLGKVCLRNQVIYYSVLPSLSFFLIFFLILPTLFTRCSGFGLSFWEYAKKTRLGTAD